MNKRTLVVIASLVLTGFLAGIVVYQQIEIVSLNTRNSDLTLQVSQREQESDSLKSDYYRLNSTLYLLQQNYSILLESYSNLSQRVETLENSIARLYQELEGYDGPFIFFDKSIYFPDAEVFWNQSGSIVPIGITLIDHDVSFNFVTVNISSSVDIKEVTLEKSSSGVFSGTVLAKGLQLDEMVTNTGVFHVRYGDKITVAYDDGTQTSALFAFPKYVGGEIDYSTWVNWKTFDPNGIPLVDYGPSIGLQYNPVFVGAYALANYQEYLNTGNISFREKFFVQANWLVENADLKGNFSVWKYTFDWPWGNYNVSVPYVSALAQGKGLSVLIRAYLMSGNDTYLEVAETAMMSFKFEMNEGGVRYAGSDGVWYEEIADEGAVSGKVLNGFLSALMSLYEYSFATNDAQGYTLFLEGKNTLSTNLYRYDTGQWSYYDLLHRSLAPLNYHKMHIEQLKIIYQLTEDKIFLEYSERFQSYLG